MRILWFTPTLFAPNNSDVIDTAAENTKPELSPIKLVLVRNAALLPDMASKINAIGVGTRAAANHPVLAKRIFLHRQTILVVNYYVNGKYYTYRRIEFNFDVLLM